MSTLREAAEQALKALGVATTPFPKDQQEVRSAMDALRAALSAAPAPQPAGGEPQPAVQLTEEDVRRIVRDELAKGGA